MTAKCIMLLLLILAGLLAAFFSGYYLLHALGRHPSPSDSVPFLILILLSAGFLVAMSLWQNGSINRRRKESADLAAHHPAFRLLCDQAHDMMFICDGRDRIIYINPLTCSLLGYASEQIRNRPVLNFIHEPDRHVLLNKEMKRVPQDRSRPMPEIHLVCENGELLEAECQIFPVDRKEEGGYTAFVLRDMNGRRKSEVLSGMQDADRQNQPARGSALIPVCASCKNIRQGKDSWISIEDYVHRHYGCRFTHSICQKCQHKLYPELFDS